MEKSKTKILTEATRAILSPLLRLLMTYGLTYRDFCEVAKQEYYACGRTILMRQGKKITDSQLALITGIHRKDISALGDADLRPEVLPAMRGSVCAALVAEWISNDLFLDRDGQPLPLPYVSKSNREPSFTQMVECVSKDVRPKAMLVEMERLGLVDVLKDKPQVVTLRKNAFLPTDDFREKISFLKRNLGDHVGAAVSNVVGGEKSFFERSAFHDGLTLEDIDALQKFLEDDGMALLKKIYRKAGDAAKDNKEGDADHYRVTCGVYFFAEPVKKQDGVASDES